MSKKLARKNSVLTFAIVLCCVVFAASTLSLLLWWYLLQTVIPNVGHAIDTIFPQTVYSLRTPIATRMMFVISLFGADFTLLIGAVSILFFQRMHKKRESGIFVVALAIGLLLNLFLKFAFHRMRPDMAPLVILDSYSYPSAHAMNAFIFYGLLTYYLVVFTKRELLEVVVAVFSISMVLLVGFSRVYLGVHYPTDVLAGYIAGFWVVMGAVYLYKNKLRLIK